MIIEDISNSLKIKKQDLDNIIDQFNKYHQNIKQNQELDLKKAYQILEVNENDDLNTIKTKYKKLVRKYHPDILTGKGENQETIDQATQKIQEINQAYETIKKNHKN